MEWFQKNHHSSCAIEIKNTKKNTIPKKSLQEHQYLALRDANGPQGIIHKLSDEARRKQPFDSFQLVNVPAYVVACFSTYHYCLVFPIDQWNGAHYEDDALYRIDI